MEDLDKELKIYLEEINGIGTCLRHPLVFAVPYSSMINELLNKQKRLN